MAETGINDLELVCLQRIFACLRPADAARACCVHPLWRAVAGDDALWQPHLAADFAAHAAEAPGGAPVATFRAAYSAWAEEFSDVSGPLLARALACWASIKAWLAQHSPQILATLNPGATREELEAAEQELGHPLPLAVRCIYRVHNGQQLRLQAHPAGGPPPPNLLMGLFGTLMFYDHVTSNAMQPLSEVTRLTLLFRSIRPLGARHPLLPPHHVVFAHSFKPNDKVCVLDADSGSIHLQLPGRRWPLAPQRDSHEGARDGLLRWMEEYARRLSRGWYGGAVSLARSQSLEEAGVAVAGSISLFPRAYPAAASAITRGVLVSWSSVLVPQESRQGRLMFTYCVRFTLLTPQQEAAERRRLEQERLLWEAEERQHLRPGGGAEAGAAPPGPSHQQASSAAAAGAAVALQQHQQRQLLAVGPCDASAGHACVPPTLQLPAQWAARPPPAAAELGAGGSEGGAPGTGAAAAAALAPAGDAGGAAPSASSAAAAAATPSSCQLESRDWRIVDPEGALVDTVSGEGVVGLYPLLVPGGEEFAYASCTPFAVGGGGRDPGAGAGGGEAPEALVGRVVGAMQGSFAFVEGSMMQRIGPEFEVACPRLAFAVPEYLY